MLPPFKRAGVAAGSAILIAILWPSDIALVSVKRGTGAVIHGIHGTAAHAQVLGLYDPAIIDCVANAITNKAVVPPAPSAAPPAAAPVAAVPVAGVLAVLAVLAVQAMVRAVPLV
jgi:hypothetical protein